MKTMRYQFLLCYTAISLSVPISSLASGSYVARPPVPSVQSKAEERAKYSLGKRIFNDKLKPDAEQAVVEGAAEKQQPRLEKLQKLLPERVARKKDLTDFAGKLNQEQLDALEFYVNKRFNSN
jgi:hypothetical protein